MRPLRLPPAIVPAPLRGADPGGPNGAFRYVARPAVRGRPKPRLEAVADYSTFMAAVLEARMDCGKPDDVVHPVSPNSFYPYPKAVARRKIAEVKNAAAHSILCFVGCGRL